MDEIQVNTHRCVMASFVTVVSQFYVQGASGFVPYLWLSLAQLLQR